MAAARRSGGGEGEEGCDGPLPVEAFRAQIQRWTRSRVRMAMRDKQGPRLTRAHKDWIGKLTRVAVAQAVAFFGELATEQGGGVTRRQWLEVPRPRLCAGLRYIFHTDYIASHPKSESNRAMHDGSNKLLHELDLDMALVEAEEGRRAAAAGGKQEL